MNTIDNQNHLDVESISRYAEAMHSGNMEAISEQMVIHVENCTQCNGEVVELFTVLKKIKLESGTPKTKQKETKVFSLNPVLRLALAASVTALAIFTYFQMNSTSHNNGANEIVADTTSATTSDAPRLVENNSPAQSKTIPKDVKNQENQKTVPPDHPSTEQQYAANFTPADDYEALIGTTFRSNTLEAISPAPGSRFQKEELITFSWDLKNSEFLYMTILNNQEEIISHQETSLSVYKTREITIPGLYYWKLETEDELLYVGKFYIDN